VLLTHIVVFVVTESSVIFFIYLGTKRALDFYKRNVNARNKLKTKTRYKNFSFGLKS
jgi:hypothetical protein